MLTWMFVSLAHAEEAAPGFTMAEIWAHSGFIARFVIITLIAMLVGTIWVGIERGLAFRRARQHSMELGGIIVGPLQSGDIAKAIELTNDEAYKSGYLTGLLKAGLAEFSGESVDAFTLENAQRAVSKAHGEELAKLQQGMTILATTGSTAPFVGLFGTTFGVINAFQGMAEAGAGLAAISAGISEALITTGVGIGVAVWGVWLFNFFNFKIQKVSEELDSSEADFVQWAAKYVHGQGLKAAK